MKKNQKMSIDDLLTKVKKNLVLTHNQDDALLEQFIKAAINYAESIQNVAFGSYTITPMSQTTERGVIMLASHFYESRDNSTAVFFSNNTQEGQQLWEKVNNLLQIEFE